jgi:hypothetical protein
MWVDRFDSPLDVIFELQDKVASSVAGAIEPALRAAEIRRSARWPTHDLTAYDFYLRALPNRAAYDRTIRPARSICSGTRSSATHDTAPPSPWRPSVITFS